MAKSAYKIDRGVSILKTKLHPNPWNPNKMKPRQQEAVSESIGLFGQVIEILVRPHPDIDGEFQIIDGEHRFNVLPEIVYCNVIHGLSDPEAKKLTIIMNETRGDADKIELAQLLAELEVDLGDDLITGLPYDTAELEEMVKLAEVDWEQFEDNFENDTTQGGSSDEPGWTTVVVKLPNDALDVLNQAADLVRDERDTPLHKDQAVAWGQILEAIAADYLATPR